MVARIACVHAKYASKDLFNQSCSASDARVVNRDRSTVKDISHQQAVSAHTERADLAPSDSNRYPVPEERDHQWHR